ncbi:MAG: TetR family transcriptional regulator C-terminal domain-containing protein [Rubrobacteraceae bacterium]
MRKGERTRRAIIERSAPVFNTKGYFGTSMNDLVRETGLEKGGIYNHFGGKEELALAAFEYAVGVMERRYAAAMKGKDGALEKLFAVMYEMAGIVEDPPVAGGCPVLNSAVESTDANPALKERAREFANGWLRLVGSLVKEGISTGEFRPDADPRKTASIVVSTLEGAVMLSRLHEDPSHMRRAVEHLEEYLGSLTNEEVTE